VKLLCSYGSISENFCHAAKTQLSAIVYKDGHRSRAGFSQVSFVKIFSLSFFCQIFRQTFVSHSLFIRRPFVSHSLIHYSLFV